MNDAELIQEGKWTNMALAGLMSGAAMFSPEAKAAKANPTKQDSTYSELKPITPLGVKEKPKAEPQQKIATPSTKTWKEIALERLKKSEGYKSVPYYASSAEKTKGIKTVGYGFTVTKEKLPIIKAAGTTPEKLLTTKTSPEMAERLMSKYIDMVMVPELDKHFGFSNIENEEFKAAIVDLVYNKGITNTLTLPNIKRDIRQENIDGIIKTLKGSKMMNVAYQKSRGTPGLVARGQSIINLLEKSKQSQVNEGYGEILAKLFAPFAGGGSGNTTSSDPTSRKMSGLSPEKRKAYAARKNAQYAAAGMNKMVDENGVFYKKDASGNWVSTDGSKRMPASGGSSGGSSSLIPRSSRKDDIDAERKHELAMELLKKKAEIKASEDRYKREAEQLKLSIEKEYAARQAKEAARLKLKLEKLKRENELKIAQQKAEIARIKAEAEVEKKRIEASKPPKPPAAPKVPKTPKPAKIPPKKIENVITHTLSNINVISNGYEWEYKTKHSDATGVTLFGTGINMSDTARKKEEWGCRYLCTAYLMTVPGTDEKQESKYKNIESVMASIGGIEDVSRKEITTVEDLVRITREVAIARGKHHSKQKVLPADEIEKLNDFSASVKDYMGDYQTLIYKTYIEQDILPKLYMLPFISHLTEKQMVGLCLYYFFVGIDELPNNDKLTTMTDYNLLPFTTAISSDMKRLGIDQNSTRAKTIMKFVNGI